MRYVKLLAVSLILVISGCQYGPKRDYSKFTTAALAENGKMVVFTFHDLTYRPAKGMAAFPDGGIPKYITDSSVLVKFDRSTLKLTKLLESKNKEWTNGSGVLHIVTSRGSALLLSQSGQRRDDLSTTLTRHHILHLETGKHETFDLAEELRRQGRSKGAIYMIDDDGSLLIVSESPYDASAKRTGAAAVPELWIRRPGGKYLFAGASAHYQETLEGDVIYWRPEDRKHYAFNIHTGSTRLLENYRTPAMKHVSEGVNVGLIGASVDMGVETNGVWTYTPLPIDADAVRGL